MVVLVSTKDHDRGPPTLEVPHGVGVLGDALDRQLTPSLAPAPTPPLHPTTALAVPRQRQTAAGPPAQ